MIALFKGLGLLLQDNELYNSPFEKQVAHWRNKSEQQIREEVAVLAKAKGQWLMASIVGWQASSLLILGLISNYLWKDDFHITFTRVVIVFGSWVSILFVIWFMANMFDHTAGFERWMKAFNSRARITSDADTVECVAEALDMAQHYPEVPDYKQAVSAKRELRHERHPHHARDRPDEAAHRTGRPAQPCRRAAQRHQPASAARVLTLLQSGGSHDATVITHGGIVLSGPR